MSTKRSKANRGPTSQGFIVKLDGKEIPGSPTESDAWRKFKETYDAHDGHVQLCRNGKPVAEIMAGPRSSVVSRRG